MKKYIHYCWFGDKPLPKLAKKCIKSWKKYLPDYEIVKWSEENVDLKECEFIKGAYENKKWAFVADFVRAKALNEMGGIYFDVDMEITNDITHILNDETFLGVEDSGKVAVGVWFEKYKNSYLSEEMISYYKNIKSFNVDDVFEYAIPVLISNILGKIGFVELVDDIQKLDKGIVIYPREYFYPLSYNRQNNKFTEKSCMIHYYDASWVPKAEKREIRIFRIFGQKNGQKVIDFLRFFKRSIKRMLKLILFPLVIHRNKKRKQIYVENNLSDVAIQLENIRTKEIIAFYNNEWIGTKHSTKEIFKNTVGLNSYHDDMLIKKIADFILEKKPKMLVFSPVDLTWINLIKQIRSIDKKIIIKILWHGSNAMNIEEYDWKVLKSILHLSKSKTINSIGFVKKSMYEFYKAKNYNVEFVMNMINIDEYKSDVKSIAKTKNVKIGLYASGDRWVKNFYNQLSAASLIKNHQIDCIPLTNKTREFCALIDANVNGVSVPLPRNELLERISTNDINVYTTFVECAPLLPLESFEMGVPCITSNNHHYWEGSKLEEYLIVNAPDNIIEIKNKIELVLKNKDLIIKLYNEWKKEYVKSAQKSIDKFMEVK